jgi:hypothetical protein
MLTVSEFELSTDQLSSKHLFPTQIRANMYNMQADVTNAYRLIIVKTLKLSFSTYVLPNEKAHRSIENVSVFIVY